MFRTQIIRSLPAFRSSPIASPSFSSISLQVSHPVGQDPTLATSNFFFPLFTASIIAIIVARHIVEQRFGTVAIAD